MSRYVDEAALNPVNFQETTSPINRRWTKTLILAGAATTIGLSLPVGYNIGVVNSPADVSKKQGVKSECQ